MFRYTTRKEMDKFLQHLVESKTFDAILRLPSTKPYDFLASLVFVNKIDENKLKMKIKKLKSKMCKIKISEINKKSNKLFFKCIDVRTFHKIRKILPHSILRDRAAKYLEDEFLSALDIYAAIPESTPRPIALVTSKNGRKTIGALYEYVEGRNLNECDERFRKMNDYKSSIKARSDLVAAIKRLQSRNAAHGDISPENVLVTNRGIKLIDPAPISEFYRNRIWDKLLYLEGYKRDILVKFDFR
ncbi:MAG: hypothetical protein M1286_04130 [Candidatus Marsarchaeota archaeon]|nr:hypothetical protein [Candidatus Marsarchaeota archaeon]